jgi:hypothetical protein
MGLPNNALSQDISRPRQCKILHIGVLQRDGWKVDRGRQRGPQDVYLGFADKRDCSDTGRSSRCRRRRCCQSVPFVEFSFSNQHTSSGTSERKHDCDGIN